MHLRCVSCSRHSGTFKYRSNGSALTGILLCAAGLLSIAPPPGTTTTLWSSLDLARYFSAWCHGARACGADVEIKPLNEAKIRRQKSHCNQEAETKLQQDLGTKLWAGANFKKTMMEMQTHRRPSKIAVSNYVWTPSTISSALRDAHRKVLWRT